jgi:hypothetical protein
MDRGRDDLESAADGDEPKYQRNITNSSTTRRFPARHLPDIDISADRTDERAGQCRSEPCLLIIFLLG